MSNAIALVKTSGFYQDIVLKFLSKMEKGTLRLTLHDGESISIGDGKGISASITIKDEEFYKRCILFGDIGFGEAYVDGLWDTDNITNVIKWVLLNIDNAPGVSGSKMQSAALNILKVFNKITHLNRRIYRSITI
jgi:cyclopropane-fatty-acyl-phospholipid synthase